VIAVSAVDGTATTFYVIGPSSGAVAVDPVPAGWVDGGAGALPVSLLPVGSVAVVPGDGGVGASPGVYTVTASGAWTSHPLVSGQLLSISPAPTGGGGSDPGFLLRASNRTRALDPVDRIDTVLGASALDGVDTRIDGVDTRIDRIDTRIALVDQRAAFAAELAAGITRVFRFTDHGASRWSTTSRTSSFTVGISVRGLRMPRRQPAGDGYAEWFTQPHDSGAGSWDNFEAADLWADTTFWDSASAVPSAGQAAGGEVRGFWEQTESGGSTDGPGWFPDLLLAPNVWTETMLTVDFATSTGRMWLRVPYDLGDGGTYHVDTHDGALFRLMSTLTSAKFASIDAHIEDWWMGNRYSGDIARLVVRDGIDGTLIAAPDASTVTPGATSFTDSAGATWTAGATAKVVDLDAVDAADITSGTVATARLGTGGDGSGTHFLADDQTFKAIGSSEAGIGRVGGLWYSLGGVVNNSATSSPDAVGKFVAHPIYLPAGAYDRVGVMTTAAGTATWRFGLYPNATATCMPDGEALIADFGTVDMSVTPGLLTATISLTVPTSGIYWAAILVDAHTSIPAVYGWDGNLGRVPFLPYAGWVISESSARGQWGRQAYGVATGAMPAVSPTAFGADVRVPQIRFRAAA